MICKVLDEVLAWDWDSWGFYEGNKLQMEQDTFKAPATIVRIYRDEKYPVPLYSVVFNHRPNEISNGHFRFEFKEKKPRPFPPITKNVDNIMTVEGYRLIGIATMTPDKGWWRSLAETPSGELVTMEFYTIGEWSSRDV